MPINERVIFDAAVEIPDPGARRAFVEKACEGDAELQARVLSLLKSHTDAGSFLEIPAAEPLGKGSAEITDNTIVGVPMGNDDDDSDDESNRVDLSFLQPSTKAGSIGTLGHYEILKVLGQGGFGVVFKAFDEKLHRHVAIKVMNPQMAATSPPRKRFLREARSAAAIRHDNIVAVHSVEEQPLPYLVMEFIDGQTLQQKLDGNGPLDVTEVLYLGQQIASGLAAAHALSLIHRDIKPGNILIEGDVEQKVKITDFGLARASDDASLTRSGMISGTPMYMAPEQAMGQPLDHRTDLFSLGSVLYQMACGRPPFRAPNTVAVLRRVAEDTPRALQEIVPELPDWLVVIINKLLAKKPEDRYQSAKQVAEVLGKCAAELQSTGRVTCVDQIVPPQPTASSIPVASATAVPLMFDPKRMRLLFWASIAAAASIIIPVCLFDTWPWQLQLLPGALVILVIVRFVLLPRRLRSRSTRIPAVKEQVAHRRPTWKSVAMSIVFGLLMISPILYGRHLSRVVSSWFWGPIQTLPAVERAAGLRFDGEDDFVQVPVQWDHPQFTIEAFVTPEEAGPHRTLVEISNYGSGAKDERLELYDAVGGKGERLSFAAVAGRNGSLNAFGPQTPGVREHRAIVCDGQEIHYYINGVWQGKRNNQPQDNQLWRMRWLTIGCQLGEKNFFKGEIDQLRISKVARYLDNFPAISLVESDDATLALYNFEEGTGDVLKDISGNGLDAKISGAAWIHPAQGLQFDGVEDYVEFTGLGWNSNQYTIEAYISQDGGHGNVLQTEGSGGMFHMYLYRNGGGAGINRDQVYANANGPRPMKTRQHLAVVYDGQNLNYFVQGQLKGAKPNVSAAATPMPLDRMTIGSKLQNDPSKPEFFEGRLEQLRVSKTARYVLPFKPGELSTDDSTLAMYDFTVGQGEVVKDVSGRSPDGKIVGAKWVNSKSGDLTSNPNSPPSEISESKSQISDPSTGWHGWPSEAPAPAPAIAPFDAEQAKQHQEAWAKYLNVPVEYTNSIGMKFRLIPPGEFIMGSTAEEIEAALKHVDNQYWQECIKNEAPQHKVILTQPFYLGVNEVTQAEYEKVMGVNPSHFAPKGMGKDAVAGLETTDHPVEMVSWNDVAEFCVKLSEQQDLKPFYVRDGETVAPLDGTGYRLPSEAEWESACRAGTTTKFWIGEKDEDLVRAGWCSLNSGYRTHAAGELKANPFGLYDIHGNVWEWVQDGWDASFYRQFEKMPAIDPNSRFSNDLHYVFRGGSWADPAASACRSSFRCYYPRSIRHQGVGFRVALSADTVKAALESRPAPASIPNASATGWHGWPSDAPAPAIAPFNAEQANQHQEAWAKYLNVPVEYTNSIGMKFVLIPPGEFTMGSTAEEINELKSFNTDDPHWNECLKSEGPIRRITLSSAFYLGTCEVTQGEYQRVIGSNPSHFANGAMGEPAIEGKETTMHPVETLSWSDAASFGEKLGALEKGKSSAPVGYRLPTEQEWEFACRAGTTSKFWSGDTPEDLNAVAWTQANSERRTHIVGQLKPNPFRLFDVHGNVWEWVQDRWGQNDYANQTPATISTPQAKPDSRVLRGGDIFGFAPGCRSSHRYSYSADHNWSNIGFRMVLSVELVRDLLNVTGPMRADYSPPAEPLPNPQLAPEWLDRVSKLSPEVQVTEFTAEMKLRNPEWDGVVTPKIEGGQVVSMTFDSFNVKDLSPIVGFSSLTELMALSSQINGELSDLTPLAKLKSLSTVSLGGCEKIVDLSPLRDLPITSLTISNSSVSDLSPLAGKPLQLLNANYCRALVDLSPLRGAPFQSYLGIEHSGVTDLTPIQDSPVGMLAYNADRLESNWGTIKNWPLREFHCFHAIPAETLSKLQEIKTLERIDNVPVEEYLKELDAKP